jgi:uncharacterized protein involved in outer membrane biogenesis
MFPRRRARQRRRRNIIIGCLAAFVVYSLFGFFGLPPIIKAQGEKRLGAALHRPVSIGKVSVNPYTLALTLEQFAIRERDSQGVFVGWDRLYVQFEILSLFGKEWRFVAIELNGPSAHVVVNPNGSLNFSDLLMESAAPSPASAQPAASSRPIHIKRFLLTGARVVFQDQSRAQPFATTLGPVGLSVTDFHTVGGQQAPYSFEAVTELGEKFSWHGWMEAAPFRSGGELGVSNLVLKKYAPYYAEKLGVDLVDGLLTVRGRYEVNFGEKNRVLKLIDGSVALRNLKLVERTSGESLLELPAADLTGAAADGLTFKSSVKQVTLQGGRLKLRRDADGSLNLAKLVAPPAPLPAGAPLSATSAAASTTPDFLVGEMALRDWTVEAQDLAAPQLVQLGVTGLNTSLRDFTLADGAQMPLELDLHWQPQGKLHVAGQVALKPVQADLTLQAEGLALLPLAPYLASFMEARLADGSVSAQGRTTLALTDGQPPALTFAGDAWVEKIDLLTGSPGESFAGFSDLVLNGIKVATAPQLSVALAEVNLNSPYARVVMEQNGGLNLVNAMARPAGTQPAPKPTALEPIALPGAVATASGPDIEVGRVVINGGEFNFTDRSISPQVRLAVNQFGGTLAGWSSLNPGRGDVDLKAAIDGVGPVAITGKFDPLGKNIFVDAKVAVQRVDLLPISPYVGKYAGYELARGKLFVDVQAKIADRKVDMTNLVTLEQFTLGRATNSPDATKLPVRLGIALLKDLDGKIVLPVPVQGSIDDPDFKYGKVVWGVILNTLTKVAVSPFALVGSMFGGGGQELAFDEFAPGETALTPESLAKLGTLVKAMSARPGLNLGIEGNFDEAADSYAMKRSKYLAGLRQAAWEEKQLKEAKLATLAAAGKGTPSGGQKPVVLPAVPPVVGRKDKKPVEPKIVLPPPADFALTPEEHAAIVKKLFDRKFPPGTRFGTPLPPPPFVQPPPPKPSEGFVRRVIDFVTLRDQRDKEAFVALQKKSQEEYMKQVNAVAKAGLPQEEMEGRLAEAVEVSADDLRALAATRAQVVRNYLINEGKIAPERLFMTQASAPVETVAPAEGAAPAVSKGPRVFLELQ